MGLSMNLSKLFLGILVLTAGNCLSLNAAPLEIKSKESAENTIELWLPKKPWAAILDRIVDINPYIAKTAKVFSKSVKLTNAYGKYGVDSTDPLAKNLLEDSFKYCTATVLLMGKTVPYLEYKHSPQGESYSLKPEFIECLTSNTPATQEKFIKIFKSDVTDEQFNEAIQNPLLVAMLLDQAILLMNNKAHDGYFLPDFDAFYADLFKMLANKN